MYHLLQHHQQATASSADNTKTEITALSTTRRGFIKTISAGSGVFMLGCGVAPSLSQAAAAATPDLSSLVFNAFLKITPDNRVIVSIKHLDKGQGVTTGLTTIVADELGASWQQMDWEFAPADAKRYNNLYWGQSQGTGGSTSIANSWDQLRNTGASAREMFIQAATKKWQVEVGNITVKDGIVSDGKHSATLGELAAEAAKQSVPKEPKLKKTADLQLIGKDIPRKDSPEKVNGSAIYTQDIHLPGMLTALVLFPPKLRGKLISVDDKEAKKMPGVVDVVKIPRGVAVVAENFWTAKKARDTLQAKWDLSASESRGTDQLKQALTNATKQKNHVITTRGDAATTIAKDDIKGQVIEAEYHLPYMAHAAMEPMNCVVQVTDNGAEYWFGSQAPTIDQSQTAEILGISPDKVIIHTHYAGGSFGRRACPDDYVLDALHIAKNIKGRPVKMVWTREDDMQNCRFRPMSAHAIKAKVSTSGELLAWQHNAAAQPILRGTPFGGMIQGPVDPTVYEGISDLAYDFENFEVRATEFESPISTLWWRSVGHSSNAFVVETFVDQLARAAKVDPLSFRRKMLSKEPRWLGVLNLAAEKANWGKKLPKGTAQGIAVHKAMGSWVAQVAEVTVSGKDIRVNHVTCAIDCGIVINPDIVKAQMEGSIGFALGAIFGEEITLKEGHVEQKNFDSYTPLRMNQMPEVDVYMVDSTERPSGVGEPGVPPLTPAVANAVFAITGKPVTQLPIKLV
ncbi:Isoquinoline 1-oxidoreductase subunit beta [Thalassocella blandensis]|nr:Isoquinoline 1-oxidoreductase subunit beta [Thalassocella blandensis]